MYLWIIISLFILFLAYSWCYNYRIKDKHYILNEKSVPDCLKGKTIALLADLHGNELGKQNSKIIQIIEREKPDYMFMAGDMVFDEEQQNDKVKNLCEQLSKLCPVYASAGNHEEEIGIEETKQLFDGTGVKFLYNQSILVDRQGVKIQIAGLAIMEEFYGRLWKRRRMTKADVTTMLGEKQGDYSILLAHNPEHSEAYADWGADLILSGHMHAGVMKLPVLGGVIAPSLFLFPKYDYGIKHYKQSTIAISGGMGLHGIKFRFFNMPEIVFLHFE